MRNIWSEGNTPTLIDTKENLGKLECMPKKLLISLWFLTSVYLITGCGENGQVGTSATEASSGSTITTSGAVGIPIHATFCVNEIGLAYIYYATFELGPSSLISKPWNTVSGTTSYPVDMKFEIDAPTTSVTEITDHADAKFDTAGDFDPNILVFNFSDDLNVVGQLVNNDVISFEMRDPNNNDALLFKGTYTYRRFPDDSCYGSNAGHRKIKSYQDMMPVNWAP